MQYRQAGLYSSRLIILFSTETANQTLKSDNPEIASLYRMAGHRI